MHAPRNAFFLVFGLSVLIGLGLGIANIVSPGLVSLSLNGHVVAGMENIWLGLFVSAVPGFILGPVAMGVRSRVTGTRQSNKETE